MKNVRHVCYNVTSIQDERVDERYTMYTLGVLFVVRVEAISESLDLAVKSGGRETKKARGAPTTSQYRRKIKLGEMKDWAKSRRKTVRYRSPTTRTPIS